MRNYKKIRQKPYIYGFSLVGFFAFLAITVLLMLILLSGFSLIKYLIVFILIGLNYLFCRHVLSSEKVQQKIFDKNLPKNYSIYE